MKPNQQDRLNIEGLHVISSGTGPIRDLRDASGSAKDTGPWKRAPTLIPAPSNVVQPNNNIPNPYGNRRTGTTMHGSNNHYNPKAGNFTAKQTITGLPNKRQKLDHQFSSQARSEQRGRRIKQDIRGHVFRPISRRGSRFDSGKGGKSDHVPPLPPDIDIINIDEDDEEDLGHRVMPSSDDLNIKDAPYTVGAQKPKLNINSPDEHPFDSRAGSNVISGRFNAIPDGSSTVKLRKHYNEQEAQEHSDPIDNFDSTPAKPRPISEGFVKEKVELLERRDIRHIDFRKFKVKDGMKPKVQSNLFLRDPITTSNSKFTNGSNEPVEKTSRKAARKTSAIHFSLKEWFLGYKHLSEDVMSSLVWVEGGNTLTIKWGEFGKPPNREMMLFLDHDVRSVQCPTESFNATFKDPQISLKTYSTLKRKPPSEFDKYFKPSASTAQGEVTFKFSSDHPDWNQPAFRKLVVWLKKTVTDHESINIATASILWDTRKQEAYTKCSQIDRKTLKQSAENNSEVKTMSRSRKRPAPSDVKSLKQSSERSPPPTIVDIATNSTSKQVSGDRRTPFEVLDPPSKGRSRPTPAYKASGEVAGPSEPLRRSSRHSGTQSSRPSPPADPDELILVYPPAVTGAVNITNLDLSRLQPGEFLNDTLIEFGLKLWLKELEDNDPELANQIHVFSSFFYKKLNKKNLVEGYQSVRKWTSKFDLFQKKYIIVPINEHLHWYLLIIYQPEHVLLPPLESPQRTSARQRARLSHTNEVSGKPPERLALVNRATSPSATAIDDDPFEPHRPTPSDVQGEVEVEDTLLDFGSSCSITVTTGDRSYTTGRMLNPKDLEMHIDPDILGMPPSSLSPIDDDDMEIDELQPEARTGIPREISPTVSDIRDSYPGSRKHSTDRETVHSDTPPVHVIDIEGDSPLAAVPWPEDDSAKLSDTGYTAATAEVTAVKPTNFYGTTSRKSKGMQKPDPCLETSPMDVEDQVDELMHERPVTYIFTLDSLGSRHPQAINNLRQYLQLEAQDKKGYVETSKPKGMSALVPVQPNYCDCGIYLLHFAQTFMKDPAHYCRTICRRKRTSTITERQADWDDASVGGIREKLAGRIEELSVEWKRERAVKEEMRRKEALEGNGEAEVVESSDDEIDIVEDITPVVVDGKGKGKAGRGGKVTGKANRMRG